MKRSKYGVVLLIIVAVFVGYFIAKGQVKWIGFYYPDVNDLSKYNRSSELKSFEACREWVDSQVGIYNPSGEGYDYECGKNCRFDDSFQLYICKETVK